MHTRTPLLSINFPLICSIDSPLSAKIAPSGGGLATTASLERVMDGLGESEKYNAVLQGVSSILMSKNGRASGTGAFDEVFQLLDEMHVNRIKCTIRTASAVVDAATATANVGIISEGENFDFFFVTGLCRLQQINVEEDLFLPVATSGFDATADVSRRRNESP